MSNLISAQAISKAFGVQTLFQELDFNLEDGARIGLIGPNGAGKSTFLKILAGLEPCDEGQVVRRNYLNLVYVPQMSEFPSEATVETVVKDAAASLPESQQDASVAVMLGRLGFENPQTKVGSLSGGWQKRLTLACGLVQEPELLLLDEPTNHLDTKGVWWLEDYLRTTAASWMMVSHDRSFIDRTVSQVAELNPMFENGMFRNDGNYAEFCRRREAYLDTQERHYESLKNKVRRETEWLQAGVKARTTKAKYRIDAAWAMIHELSAMKQRRSQRQAGIAFSASHRKTKKLIEIQNLSKSLGDKSLLKNLDFVFKPGSRTGILGVNGTGKTTFLRLLMGHLEPDTGTVRHAPDLKLVYFDQDRSQLNQDQSVKDALSPTGTDSVIYRGESVHVLSWAGRFKFGADQMRMPVSRLSGGEQARLLIARLMLEQADVLLLDEPTNDLDIPTLEILEESLLDFAGALILVTHDRFMLERVGTQFLAFSGDGDLFPCSDFRQWERGQRETKAKKATSPKTKTQKQQAKKLSYKEQRELDGMEAAILEAEEKLEACQAHANDPAIASNGTELTKAYEALSNAESEVAQLYDRWSELTAKQEALQG